MLLKDYKEWKNKEMMNQHSIGPETGMIGDGQQKEPRVLYQVERNHVVLLNINNDMGLFYSANVVVECMEYFKSELAQEKSISNYWRSRCEDIETAYNLQKSSLEHVDRDMKEKNEKIQILSEALTRSKLKERGKLIYISRLQNQLNANSKSRVRRIPKK